MLSLRSIPLAVLPLALVLPASAETASQVFQQDAPSIVVVLTYDATGKPTELGSGVKLPNGTVATNCHVLKDGTQYQVRYQDKEYPAHLHQSDWDRDVCSLEVPGLPAPPVVLGSTQTLQVGAKVYAIGTPEGLQRTLSEGIVSSLRQVADGSYIQTTAAISPGSSGGGLFDDQGRLLGLTSFFVSNGQQLNFALPVEWIEALPQHSSARIAGNVTEVDWLNRAEALEKTKDWQGLQALAERWTKVESGNSVAWVALGEAFQNNGESAKAIGAYRHALRTNPQTEVAWDDLGSAYADVHQYLRAVDAEQHALRINQNDENAWNNLGADYDGQRQYRQAISAYRQALLINPQNELVWHNLGRAYNSAGQDNQSIGALRRALVLDPKDESAWSDLGFIYLGDGQYAQAIDAERQAVQINPEDDGAWFKLGEAYIGAGQQENAIAVYQHLKTRAPFLAESLFDEIVPR